MNSLHCQSLKKTVWQWVCHKLYLISVYKKAFMLFIVLKIIQAELISNLPDLFSPQQRWKQHKVLPIHKNQLTVKGFDGREADKHNRLNAEPELTQTCQNIPLQCFDFSALLRPLAAEEEGSLVRGLAVLIVSVHHTRFWRMFHVYCFPGEELPPWRFWQPNWLSNSLLYLFFI